MTYHPDRHHRRSVRLQGYDYTSAGAYFVTICAKDRACLFGEVVDGEMRLNDAGTIVLNAWAELPSHYPAVQIDEFVVMPNHVHGIVVLSEPDDGNDRDVGAQSIAPPIRTGERQMGRAAIRNRQPHHGVPAAHDPVGNGRNIRGGIEHEAAVADTGIAKRRRQIAEAQVLIVRNGAPDQGDAHGGRVDRQVHDGSKHATMVP